MNARPAPPEILYFGCLGKVGHYLHSKYSAELENWETPWGYELDGALLSDNDTTPTGDLMVSRRDGWTAVALWDRSADTRPGSFSAFLVDQDWTAGKVMEEAERQWPEVCGRSGFPVGVNK